LTIGGKRCGSTSTDTETGDRAASDSTAGPSPGSVRICGWILARELAQLGQGRLGLGRGLVQADPRRRVEVVAEPGSGQAQRQGQGHEALLGTVVEVPLHALSLGIAGRDNPRA
jgi:hypothetical protein